MNIALLVSWLSSSGHFPRGPCAGYNPVLGNLYQVVSQIHYNWYSEVNILSSSESLYWVTFLHFSVSKVVNVVTAQHCALVHGIFFLCNCICVYLSMSEVVNVVVTQHCTPAKGTLSFRVIN